MGLCFCKTLLAVSIMEIDEVTQQKDNLCIVGSIKGALNLQKPYSELSKPVLNTSYTMIENTTFQ